MAQGGDFVMGNGSGGESIWGKKVLDVAQNCAVCCVVLCCCMLLMSPAAVQGRPGRAEAEGGQTRAALHGEHGQEQQLVSGTPGVQI